MKPKATISFLKAAAALSLIIVIQIGSSGMLINKHFCKGSLKEVSILLANNGCSDDQTLVDRLTFKAIDCKKGMEGNGVRKAPCCDFESFFNKIFVFQDAADGFQMIQVFPCKPFADTIHTEATKASNWRTTVYRPPPDNGLNICIELCRFLI